MRIERLAGEFERLRIEEEEAVKQQPARQEEDVAAGVQCERSQLASQEEQQEEEDEERNAAHPEVREDAEAPVERPYREPKEPLLAIREVVL